jgi:RNA polymerase sigma factor (sigma-70 family)
MRESDQLLLLQKLIAKLPEKRQRVFKMHRMEGYSYAEIAEQLDISIRTVEDHLAKSMSFLHEHMHQLLNK